MEVFFVITVVLLSLSAVPTVSFAALSVVSRVRLGRFLKNRDVDYAPLVSIIVPSYNEDVTIRNCVNSLVAQTYANIEILLVNDGSSDDTWKINRELSAMYRQVVAVDKYNAGKASALNYGIQRAMGEIVVCIDADSVFAPDAVELLVAPFSDPDISAVGGNVKVVNRGTLLGHLQAVEYLYGLTIQRQAFNLLGCIQVIPGPIGAFRKSVVEEVGYYPTDTLVEDMDMTITLSRAGKKVVYNPRAVAYTEAPENLNAFFTQRLRWMYGCWQVAHKHRDMLFNPRYKTMGMFGFPYVFFFPMADVLQNAAVVTTMFLLAGTGNTLALLVFYAILVGVRTALITYSVLSERESARLILFAGVTTLAYNLIVNAATVRAAFNYIRKSNIGWNKLERLGKNVISVPA